MVIRCFIAIIASLLFVLGCSSSSQSTPEPDNQDNVLIIYQRTGGLAGFRDHLTIYSDGRCQLQRKSVEREFTIPLSQVAHLENLMNEADFVDLRDSHLPTKTGADFFEYVVSYQAGESKMHTVHTMSGVVPDAMQPILNELNKLISSNS